MSKEENDPGIRPADLPQSEVFRKKEVYQHPQPADQGLPLDKDQKATTAVAEDKKEEEKTSKDEGLNEANSQGDAGAFEGFEDQQRGTNK